LTGKWPSLRGVVLKADNEAIFIMKRHCIFMVLLTMPTIPTPTAASPKPAKKLAHATAPAAPINDAIRLQDVELLQEMIEELQEENEELHIHNRMLQRDRERLVHYFEELYGNVKAVERSRAWRIGYRVMGIVKRLLGRKSGVHAFTNIDKLYVTYHHWKKSL
jgi:FtsZ-binding cell division protein ZapB